MKIKTAQISFVHPVWSLKPLQAYSKRNIKQLKPLHAPL
jgi:hypothetical protein